MKERPLRTAALVLSSPSLVPSLAAFTSFCICEGFCELVPCTGPGPSLQRMLPRALGQMPSRATSRQRLHRDAGAIYSTGYTCQPLLTLLTQQSQALEQTPSHSLS